MAKEWWEAAPLAQEKPQEWWQAAPLAQPPAAEAKPQEWWESAPLAKPAEPTESGGFFGSFGTALKERAETFLPAAKLYFGIGDHPKSTQELLKAKEESDNAYKQTEFSDIGQAFKEGHYGDALGLTIDKFKEVAGSSFGSMAPAMVAGRVGMAAAGPLGGVAAFGLTALGSYIADNIGRQKEEQAKEGREGEDINRLTATVAGAGQTALDVFGFKLFKPLGALVGIEGKEASQKVASEIIQAATKPGAYRKAVAMGIAEGIAFEVPQEVAQQVLERWQAGLPLDPFSDPEAAKEYLEAAGGALLLGGPMGGVSGALETRKNRQLAKVLDTVEGKHIANMQRYADAEETATQQLTQELGREPTEAEVTARAKNIYAAEQTDNVAPPGTTDVSIPDTSGAPADTAAGPAPPIESGLGTTTTAADTTGGGAGIKSITLTDADRAEAEAEAKAEREAIQAENKPAETVKAQVTPITQDANVMKAAPEYREEVIAPALNAIANGNFQPITLKNGTKVKLVVGNNLEDTEGRVTAFDENNNEIGHVMYTKAEDEQGNRFNPHTEVDEKYRRLGLATAMYDAAEQIGGALIPEVTQEGQIRSPEGQAFREARKQKAAPTVKKTDEELIAEEDARLADQEARRANAREIAKTNFESALDQVDSPEFNGDLDAALDSYRQNTLDTLAEQSEKDQYVSDAADREFDKLVEEHKTKQQTAKLTPEQIDAQRQLYKQLFGNEITVDDFINEHTGELWGNVEYYSATPKKYGHPVDIAPVKNLAEARQAEAQGKTIYAIDKQSEDPDLLQDLIRALEKEQLSLLKKNGHLPNNGTPKRKRWDELSNEISATKKKWVEVSNRKAVKEKPPAALPAQETEELPPLNGGMHPTVAQGVVDNDLSSALRAMIRVTSGLFSDLAARLADLNLPTNISFNSARNLIRRSLDKNVGQQQVRLFAYISRAYPEVYDKYFKNYDREENLEQVAEGLREISKPKYKLGPVIAELSDVTKQFNDLMPGLTAPGAYFPAFDEISLNTQTKTGTSNRVMLHEVVHAATLTLLHKNFNDLTPAQQKAVQSLYEAYNHAKKVLPPGDYGMTNIYEFLSEALTNRTFQNKLKQIQFKTFKTSLFDRLVQTILKLFGVNNLASNVMLAANEIFTAERISPALYAGPKFAKGKRVRGPISQPDTYRTAESVSTSLTDLFKDAVAGRMTWKEFFNMVGPAMWDADAGSFRRAVLGFANLRQIADLTKTKFPQLQGSIRLIENMLAYRGAKLKVAEDIVKDWGPMQADRPAQSSLMGRIMMEATLRGIDPATAAKGTLNKPLQDAWDSLDDDFKQVYRRVRDFYADSVTEMVREMKVRALALPKAERQKIIANINRQFGPDKLVRPYFPLRRFGEHWFQVGKGNFKEFYEFESARARNLAMENRRRELASGNAAQRALVDTMDKGSGISELYTKNIGTTKVLQDVQDIVDNVSATDTAALKAELKDSLNQLVYMLLPQQSMRKMFINRKGIQGASGDMLRVFAGTAVHSAYQQSRFKYAQPFIDNLSTARDYIKGFDNADRRAVYDDYIKEVEKRTKTILSNEDTSMVAKVAGRISESTFYFMLSAPFTALLNVIGFTQMTMPYIGGRYGYGKTNALMLKNFGRYFATVPGRTFSPMAKGRFMQMEFPSIVEGGKLDPLLQRAADRFVSDGQINISMTNDLFDMSDRPSGLYTGRYNAVKRAMAGLFHQSERLNREVTLLTTFELAHDKFKKEPKRDTRGVIERDNTGQPVMRSEKEAFEDAIAEAYDIAGMSLGDFTRQMKPRYFTPPILSVLTKFKQYAVLATYATIRNFYLAIGAPFSKSEIDDLRKMLVKDKLSPEVVEQRIKEAEAQRKELSREGRRRLAGILGMTYLYGGAQAMPFFFMLGPLIQMLASGDDDEDEFFDWENWFRNYMETELGGAASSAFAAFGMEKEGAQKAGRKVGEAAATGIVPAITGASLSERVSLDLKNLWYREGRYSPDVRANATEEIIANLGPAVGLGFNWLDAYKLMEEGKFERAFEKAAPALFSKSASAIRMASEGAKTPGGNTVIDNLTAWELAMQAVGVQPERLAQAQKAAIEAKEKEQRILNKQTMLMNRLWLEYDNDGDFETAMQNLIDFYGKYPELVGEEGIAKKITDSFRERKKAQAMANAVGASINKKLIPRIAPMLDYGRE